MNAIPSEVLSSLNDDDLKKIASAKDVGSALGSLSDDGLKKIATYKPKQGPSAAEDFGVKATEGLLFGTRPFVAGVGGGIGSAIGRMEHPTMSLSEKIKSLPGAFSSGFSDAKQAARDEEADVQERRPGMSLATGLGTAVLTAPLIAGRAIGAMKGVPALAEGASFGDKAIRMGKVLTQGAGTSAKIGAGLGAANALGHADSSGEAIESIGTGAGLGVLAQIGGNAVIAGGGQVLKAAGKGAKKLASNITGVSEKEIETYFRRADQVKDLMKKAGGDVSEAADQVRTGIMKDVQVTRQKLNNQVAEALQAPQYQGVAVDGSAVLKALDDQLGKVSKVTAEYRPGELNELKNVIDSTKKFIGADGKISVQDLHSVKQELQKVATSAYDRGQIIFPKGEVAARGAKGAAAEAKRILDEAVPELAKANRQLSRLHAIEDVMNKNLIKAGKPEAALLAAGSGANPRNARLLSSLDNITGGNAVAQAENLAAGRTFGNVPLIPTDFTGKAAARMAAGAGIGYATGGNEGSLIGLAATSPGSLKLAINAARFSQRMTSAIGGGVVKMMPRTPDGTGRAAVLNQTSKVAGEGPAETAAARRLRFLDNKRNNKQGSGE